MIAAGGLDGCMTFLEVHRRAGSWMCIGFLGPIANDLFEGYEEGTIVIQSAGKPGGRKSRMAFLEYLWSSDVIERHFGSGCS